MSRVVGNSRTTSHFYDSTSKNIKSVKNHVNEYYSKGRIKAIDRLGVMRGGNPAIHRKRDEVYTDYSQKDIVEIDKQQNKTNDNNAHFNTLRKHKDSIVSRVKNQFENEGLNELVSSFIIKIIECDKDLSNIKTVISDVFSKLDSQDKNSAIKKISRLSSSLIKEKTTVINYLRAVI